MPSFVDIVNISLSHLGEDPTVASLDPPDGSVHAEHAARVLPLQVEILAESHAWSFLLRRATLALRTDIPPDPWLYVYAMPSNVANVMSVAPMGAAADDDAVEFAIESADDGDILLCNWESPILRYTAVPTDPTRFSALFTDALAHGIASKLAGPVLRGDVGRKEAAAQEQLMLAKLAEAKNHDSRRRRIKATHSVDWQAHRDQPPRSGAGLAYFGPDA